jgi:hypothetical protein
VFNHNIARDMAERAGAAVQAALPQLSQLNASALNSTDWQRQLGNGWALASTLLQATPVGRCPLLFATYGLILCACRAFAVQQPCHTEQAPSSFSVKPIASGTCAGLACTR